jgi:hypothetical protein
VWSAQRVPCPCADPRAILEDRPLDGAGSFPAGHVQGVNGMFRQHVSRLSTCVYEFAAFATFTPHVGLHCRRRRSIGLRCNGIFDRIDVVI